MNAYKIIPKENSPYLRKQSILQYFIIASFSPSLSLSTYIHTPNSAISTSLMSLLLYTKPYGNACSHFKSHSLLSRYPFHIFIGIKKRSACTSIDTYTKGIWTMLGVRWSHAFLALPFIAFLLFTGSYKQHGITLIPFWTSMITLF